MQLYDPKTSQWYEVNTGVPIQTDQVTSPVGAEDVTYATAIGSTVNPITKEAPVGGANLVSPSGSAASMASQVLAAQFANWKQQFQPLELNLLNQSSINNSQVLTDAVGKAGATADQAYDTMAGVERRKLSSQGVAPTDAQEQVSNRIRNLSRAAAVAGAENKARQQVAYNDELIALGSAPNPQMGKKV